MAPVVICIFAKPPVPGAVKTRLATALGPQRAAELARAFLEDTIAAVKALPWAQPILSSPEPTCSELPVLMQGEGDLGARIERVLRNALQLASLAIAIGADAPALPARLLEAARDALGRADAVIGPADDGGFYLLGLRTCPERLLAGLPWSAPDTFARTTERLRERGLRVEVLERWFDVDRPEDLDRLRALIQRGDIHAPSAARLLT
jgi:rSAM/selenodomain-associated transferase 1